MSATAAHILAEASTLPLGELRHLITHFSELHESKVSQTLPSEQERMLLQEINNAVPVSLRQRWQELMTKQQYQPLSEAETQELQELVEAVGECEDKRLNLLDELAQLRGVPILQLVEMLGLRPRDQDAN
jgi:predicted HAD superfamily phosphohydrolase